MLTWLSSLLLDHLDWLPALVPGAGAIWAALRGSWRWALACAGIIAAAVIWIWISGLRHDLALSEIAAADARKAQALTAAALSRLQADQAAAQAALETVERARREAESHADALRRRIAAAPRSRACIDSPAVRGLLDDLRAAGAAGDHP
ncbi:hypothetical protein [Zavarzinia sp.]|uniref:hypothetical protein n=1 Tax=Zavarzinia sp. TaxID=2027920 RepID=UPI003BB5D7E7